MKNTGDEGNPSAGGKWGGMRLYIYNNYCSLLFGMHLKIRCVFYWEVVLLFGQLYNP